MYVVYKTTNSINGKVYVGVHKTDVVGIGYYFGSGVVLRNAIKKYGIESFRRKILFEYADKTEAYIKEREIVTPAFAKSRNTYNLKVGGVGGGGLWTKEHRSRTLASNRRFWASPEGDEMREHLREKMSKIQKGAGNGMRGKHHSEESKRYLSEINSLSPAIIAERLIDIALQRKIRGWQKRLAEKWGVCRVGRFIKKYAPDTLISFNDVTEQRISDVMAEAKTANWRRRLSNKWQINYSTTCKFIREHGLSAV